MATVISIINFKGGVAKTTTAVNLAKAFHDCGKRVLCIDSDGQGNASRMLGYRWATDKANTLYEAMSGSHNIKDCIYMENDKEDSFDYIPSKHEIYQCEQELVSKTGREYILKIILKDVQEDYDYILIDCPPNNGILSINAMCAADYLVVPINCEVFSLDGMGLITAKYEEVKRIVNPNLEILGYVMALYNAQLNLHSDACEEMHKRFPGDVFNTYIRRNVRLGESPAARTNIFDFAPESNGAADYRELAKEILEKIENRR